MAQIGQRYILLADIDLGTASADALKISVVLPSALVGVAYTGALIASGGTPPYTYDDTPPGTVPPGLTIDPSTGAVTGTPSAVGYYEFTASVTDSAFSPATASIVVSIRVLSGIAFSGSFQPGEVGIAYSDGLSASGGTPPYTWSVPSGSLPGGLGPIDSSTGIVAGTPTTPGTFNFTVRATDNLGNPQDFPTSIAIAAALDITTTTFPDGFVGVFYNAGPTVIGGVAPISYAVSSGAIPAGTTFAPSNGFVTGQPTTVATYSFDITGVDVLGGTSTVSLTVAVTTGGSTPSGDGIQTIDGIGPDSGGDFTIESTDMSVGITPTPTGIDLSAAAGSSPLTTKGDLFGHSTVDARIPVGANDLPLVADSSVALGVGYKVLPIAGGGTANTTAITAFNALSPQTTKGDIIARDSTNDVRLPVGTDGQILRANSAQSTGLEYITSALLPFAPLATEILADSPLNYFKLNDTGATYTDYGSSGNNLSPVGATPGQYVQQFSRQINTINDKFLRLVNTGAGATVSAQPTGLTLAGSWTVCAVFSARNTTSALRTFLQLSNSAATSNAIFCGIGATNGLNVIMNAGVGGAATNTGPSVAFNAPNTFGTYIYHFTKDSTTRTFSFWVNGIFLGSSTYGAINEWTGTLSSPKLTVGVDQAGANGSQGIISNVALFSSVLAEARIVAHAQAAGLYANM